MWPPAAPSPRLTGGRRQQRSDGVRPCRRTKRLHSTYKESGNRSMIWQQPKPERLWVPPLTVENTATAAEISYCVCVHGSVTQTKIKANLLVQSRIASLAIKKKGVSLCSRLFFFGICNLPFIPFLSILWILVSVILFTDLWNLHACVAVLWTSLHVWCFMCQETCWWKTLNRKHTWRAWACTMCENQIVVKSCMLDA